MRQSTSNYSDAISPSNKPPTLAHLFVTLSPDRHGPSRRRASATNEHPEAYHSNANPSCVAQDAGIAEHEVINQKEKDKETALLQCSVKN